MLLYKTILQPQYAIYENIMYLILFYCSVIKYILELILL
jgi:hypothetical protein